MKTGKNINEKDEHGRTALHYGDIIKLKNLRTALIPVYFSKFIAFTEYSRTFIE